MTNPVTRQKTSAPRGAHPAKSRGLASPAIAVALVALVVLGLVVSYGFKVLHDREEDYAYRFSGVRRQRDAYKAICDGNTLMAQRVKEWARQGHYDIPPDLSVIQPCMVPEEPDKKGE